VKALQETCPVATSESILIWKLTDLRLKIPGVSVRVWCFSIVFPSFLPFQPI